MMNLLLLAATLLVPVQERPNIVLIMADDLGYECLGCNGSSSYKTPHLDALAAGGLRFTHCYAQPLCTPSRVKLMTGKYNFRNYVDFGFLDPKERTFGNALKDAGYATCIVGKWQLNGLNRKNPGNDDNTRPNHFGFDESCLWQLTKQKGKFHQRFADPYIEQNGKILKGTHGKYGPDVFTDYAVDFIKRNREKPFLLYYPMALTHSPYVPTPDSQEWTTDRHKRNKKHFADMVAYADKIVGRIDAALKKNGLRERTILIFTGDNGTGRGITSRMGDREIQGGKGTLKDAGTRVPLVISWPGTAPKGAVLDDLVDFSDFFPTLAEAAGAKAEGLDGRSFLPQLKGEKGSPREWIFMHYDPRWGRNRKGRFARTREYKLYGNGRLYHVTKDPLEKSDLPAIDDDADRATLRKKLQRVLDKMKAGPQG